MSEWISVDESQPDNYQTVLWSCDGGPMITGMYYGEAHCKLMPDSHPISGKPRGTYGKYGRYAEPAERGYKVTHWMPLPEPPK